MAPVMLALLAPVLDAQVVVSEEQKITGSNSDPVIYFGNGLAVVDDLMVVGAPFAEQAFLYQSVGGTWTNELVVAASDSADNSGFGWTVATDGTVIAVGSRTDDDIVPNGGSVYIFRHNGVTWTEEQELHSSDVDDNDNFGEAISVDGNRVAVGSHRHDGTVADEGAVYIFEFDGTNWTEVQKLTGSNTGDQYFYGRSVSLVGDSLLVGASQDDTLVNNAGAIYVYEHDGSSFVEIDVLFPSDNGPFFGTCMARSGNRLLVGSPANAVYSLHHDGTSWVEDQILSSTDTPNHGKFGHSVALEGDVALVGAHEHDTNGINKAGAAYSFRHDGQQWIQVQKHVSSMPSSADELGFRTAISGDNLLVAANQDDGVAISHGAVLSYFLPSLALQVQPNPLSPGDPFTMLTAGGTPGQPALLFVLAVNGVPFTMRLLSGSFDASGEWSRALAVPNDPTLAGTTTTLGTFALQVGGGVVLSNPEALVIQ